MRLGKLLLLALVLVTLPLLGVRCRKGVSREVAQANQPVTLRWWRTFDDEATVRPIIEAYRAIHPNVTIEYRKIRFEDYERELVDALAEDRGPDIVSLHNTWMQRYQSKLTPLPPMITLPYSEIKGTLKKEVVVTLKTNPTFPVRALKTNFVDAVSADVLFSAPTSSGSSPEQIWGLPLALDTLALYVNRDLLNLAGIPEVPKTWSEFQGAVRRLTKLDPQGALVQSGAALGSARNVERATDILALIMMQNGAQMLTSSGAAFAQIPPGFTDRPQAPGVEALVFYTDFANPQKEVYTWSATEPNALEAFVAGRTAMFFGYAYHASLIRARAPRLNLEIAPVPQIDAGNPEVNFANYWVEAVTRKSKNQNWAWDLVQFAVSPAQVTKYLGAAQKPAALRALLPTQQEDETVGVFAGQVLTAKSWYRGHDAQAAQEALLDAIDAALAGGEPREILNVAAGRVNQTLK